MNETRESWKALGTAIVIVAILLVLGCTILQGALRSWCNTYIKQGQKGTRFLDDDALIR